MLGGLMTTPSTTLETEITAIVKRISRRPVKPTAES